MPEPEATDTTEPIAPDATTGERRPEADEAMLREAGKRAIDAERKAKADAERRAKALQDEVDRLRLAVASDSEKAVLQARAEARAEADAEWQGRLDAAEVRARDALIAGELTTQAAQRLANPHDALVFYRAGEHADLITVDEAGKVRGVKDWLDRVTKDRAYLLRADGTPRPAYAAPTAGRGGAPNANGPGVEALADNLRARGYGVRI